MQKKELNIENFVLFFNSLDNFEIGTPITSNYTTYILKNMLDYFYTEYEEIEFEKDLPNVNGICEVKDGCEFTEYHGIIKIQFNSFYPSIIKKLLEKKEIKFNVKELGLMYLFVLDNLNSIRKNEMITQNGAMMCKIFMNSIYILSCNKFNKWGLDKPRLIVEYGRNILNHIIENFNDEYIYIDTDMIITKSSKRLLEYLNSLDLKYDISSINFMIFNKKRYVIEEDGIFDVKGIRTNSTRTRRNTNDDILNAIEDFRMKLLYQSRIHKVNKILEKIKQ